MEPKEGSGLRLPEGGALPSALARAWPQWLQGWPTCGCTSPGTAAAGSRWRWILWPGHRGWRCAGSGGCHTETAGCSVLLAASAAGGRRNTAPLRSPGEQRERQSWGAGSSRQVWDVPPGGRLQGARGRPDRLLGSSQKSQGLSYSKQKWCF